MSLHRFENKSVYVTLTVNIPWKVMDSMRWKVSGFYEVESLDSSRWKVSGSYEVLVN